MTLTSRTRFALIAVFVAIATIGLVAHTQETRYAKQTQLPNPYRLVEGWPTLPRSMNGGQWGELIDPKGNIWVFIDVSTPYPPAPPPASDGRSRRFWNLIRQASV
jgi:hypothetical protein